MRVSKLASVLLTALVITCTPLRSELPSTSHIHTPVPPDPTATVAGQLRAAVAPNATPTVAGHMHPPPSPDPTPTLAIGAVSAPVPAESTPTLAGHLHPPVSPDPTPTLAIGPVSTPVLADPTPTLPGHIHPPVPTAAPSPVSSTGAPAPISSDRCQALHDSFTATGPDGRQYPTWHPPTAGGCSFGYEHGDDPRGSPALNGRAVLFGYAAVQIGHAEAHAGYKVFRQDNVNDSNAPSHTGSSVLTVLHQGSSSAKRFTADAVHHSVAFHYFNPNDGREVHVQMMAPFGTLLVGCGANDPTMVLRQQQMEELPGFRQVSADKCFNLPSIAYEDWITALYVGRDENRTWTAYIDPHFAIFEPNTYCIVTNGACTLGYSDVRAGTGADPLSTNAQFKGTKREAYLNQVWLDNRTGSTSIWTDAHGMLVSRGTPGAIEQYVAAISSRPLGNSIAFGRDRDFDDGTVHAPN